MNQLRTLSFVRTKIAVYPHSFSDVLKETRYGDVIELECDVVNNTFQYTNFMTKTVSLIERYIEKAVEIKCKAEDVFDMSVENQLIIEQLINASEGNMRRLVHLIDSSMNIAYIRCQGNERVSVEDVWEALRKQGAEMESQFQDVDKSFLSQVAKVCRGRYTYKFTFPNKSNQIGKFTNMSNEYNIINIRQAGTGRQGTVYSFDYAYCIYKDLPTHYIKDSEKIDKTRSTLVGEPIKRVAQLSDEVLLQSEIRGKIEGKVSFISTDGKNGIASGVDKKAYYIDMSSVVISNGRKKFHVGDNIRFVPAEPVNGFILAAEIEIL